MLGAVVALLLIVGVILLFVGQGGVGIILLILAALFAVVWLALYLAGRRRGVPPPV